VAPWAEIFKPRWAGVQLEVSQVLGKPKLAKENEGAKCGH